MEIDITKKIREGLAKEGFNTKKISVSERYSGGNHHVIEVKIKTLSSISEIKRIVNKVSVDENTKKALSGRKLFVKVYYDPDFIKSIKQEFYYKELK